MSPAAGVCFGPPPPPWGCGCGAGCCPHGGHLCRSDLSIPKLCTESPGFGSGKCRRLLCCSWREVSGASYRKSSLVSAPGQSAPCSAFSCCVTDWALWAPGKGCLSDLGLCVPGQGLACFTYLFLVQKALGLGIPLARTGMGRKRKPRHCPLSRMKTRRPSGVESEACGPTQP